MKIFLIRHAESMQNTKLNNTIKLPDNKVFLTDDGMIQAIEVGRFLLGYSLQNKINLDNSILWVSPFVRTRETAQIINYNLHIKDVREDISLIEQQYGLFSDHTLDEIRELYPVEFEYYDRHFQNDSKFYAKFPQGESPFDVALRLRHFIDIVLVKEKDKDAIFIVSHGTTIRCFLLDYFNYSPEWFNREANMENCAVRLIDDNRDLGYIYGGPKLNKTKVLK